MEWNSVIKEIRNRLFLTQEELAKALDVSFATVNRWENKIFEPSMKDKRKIKEFCDKNDINLGGILNG